MNPGQKIILAQKGNISERKILANDPSIDVRTALVQSAKVTEAEIERIAALPGTPEIVLKTIYSSARWQKSLRVRIACLKNPKLPAAIARKLLARFSKQQLKNIVKDPVIPMATKEAAKRIVSKR